MSDVYKSKLWREICDHACHHSTLQTSDATGYRLIVSSEDFTQFNLQKKCMSYSVINDSKFKGMNLLKTSFMFASVMACNFKGCTFDSTSIEYAAFVDSNLKGCKFIDVLFRKVSFNRCNLSNSTFEDIHRLFDVDFRNATLKNIDFGTLTFEKCFFTNADLSGSNISKAVLSENQLISIGDLTDATVGEHQLDSLSRNPRFSSFKDTLKVVEYKEHKEIPGYEFAKSNREYAARPEPTPEEIGRSMYEADLSRERVHRDIRYDFS